MTARIAPALVALKDVLETCEPAGFSRPKAVYAYPADYRAMPKPFGALPVIVVHRLGGRRRPFGSKAAGLDRHKWLAGIDVLLTPGPLMNDEQVWQADRFFEPWLETVKNVLFQNLTLSGTVDMIGSGSPSGDLFEYIDAHLQWVGATYWGIRFELPILQTIAQTMNG